MPALINTFLFIEPLAHYLEYGSLVLKQIIQANRQAGQIITELVGDQASPEGVKAELQRLQPIVFCGIGHGNVNVYSVECTSVLVTTDSPELALFKDKIVDLCSCLTAQQLGPAIMDAGAVAYAGYKEEFYFYIGDPAGTTRAVQSPFLAEFQFVASLLQGKPTGEARADQMKKHDEEIAYWTTGEGKDHADALELARILNINKSISVFLGETTITPSPIARAAIPQQITVAIPFALSFAATLYLAKVLYS